MEEPKKSKHEIIDETVAMILTKGRALNNDGNCMYRVEGKDHPGCAVGRSIHPDKYLEKYEMCSADDLTRIASLENIAYTFDDILIPDYRGHDLHFWEALQEFHDGSEFWMDASTENPKLSETGKSKLEELKEDWI